MFKLKQLSWSMLCAMVLFSTLSLVSCNSDDDAEPEDECSPEFSASVATGSFMGDTFTFVQGTADENFADSTEFRITLYGETVTGDACDGFNFDKPPLSIIFSVPMEVGLYELGLNYTVTFNDASVVNEVNAEIAICGAVEILTVSDTEVTGRIDADASEDSKLNGTFTLERCE